MAMRASLHRPIILSLFLFCHQALWLSKPIEKCHPWPSTCHFHYQEFLQHQSRDKIIKLLWTDGPQDVWQDRGQLYHSSSSLVSGLLSAASEPSLYPTKICWWRPFDKRSTFLNWNSSLASATTTTRSPRSWSRSSSMAGSAAPSVAPELFWWVRLCKVQL